MNSRIRRRIRLLLPVVSLAWSMCSPQTASAQAGPASFEGIRQLSPGVFSMDGIQIDKNAGTVTFPASANMDKGPLEYLICQTGGSTHESLLVTETRASQLHIAMLLLGAKANGSSVPPAAQRPPSKLTGEYLRNAPKLTGDRIEISLRWKDKDGAEKTAAIEDWVLNQESKQSAPKGDWLYTGSMFADGKFLAETEANFAAIVVNPAALINNPREGNQNDHIWSVNEKAVAPHGTPVNVTIHLLAGK